MRQRWSPARHAAPQLPARALCWRTHERDRMAPAGRRAAGRGGAEGRGPHGCDGGPGRLRDPRPSGGAGLGGADRVEAGLAAGMAAGVAAAAYAAALVLAGFLLFQLAALAQGNAGAPRGCFGAGGRLLRPAGRTAPLAVPARRSRAGPGRGSRSSPPPRWPPPRRARQRPPHGAARGARGRRRGPGARRDEPARGPVRGRRVGLALFTSPGCGLCKRAAPAADGRRRRRRGPPHRRGRGAEAWAAGASPARRSRSRSPRAASCSPRARRRRAPARVGVPAARARRPGRHVVRAFLSARGRRPPRRPAPA